jgi:CBS domain-containing protein
MTEKKIIRQAIKRKFPAIGLDDSLATAIDTMTKADVSVLAVKSGEDIIGLVTATDIMFSLVNEDDNRQTKISSFMTQCEADVSKPTRNPCLQLDENEDALSAAKLMYNTGLNHLLVSGNNGEIVGIISSMDLIKLFSTNA